jgi:hypothetical protein
VAWSAQSSADFRFQFGGVTDVSVASDEDGVNAVLWSGEDGGESLATTIISGGRGVLTGFDIVLFASSAGEPNAWSGPGEPGEGTLDLQGIITHELGHALGLDHSHAPLATMSPSAFGRGLPLRTLDADDVAGVESLYGLRPGDPPGVVIAAVIPAQGSTVGGNEVVLEGSGFTYDSDTAAFVNGAPIDGGAWSVQSCGRLRILALPPHPPGRVAIRVESSLGAAEIDYEYQADPLLSFRRGDANRDGSLDLSDAVVVLNFLFLGTAAGWCDDASDANDDGEVDISDALWVLSYLFTTGDPPPEPYPAAGPDPTPDPLGCWR